jgi:hypothetical protein
MLLLVNVSVNSNVVNGSICPGVHELGYGGRRKNEMSLLAICCVTAGTAGLVQLAWVALKPLPEETGERGGERMEDLLALHAQRFPQLRQALANLDDDYLRRKASGEMERHTHAERKHIVEGFLAGLAEDFGRLERLMAALQEMSPAETWRQQCQRAGSRFQFRIHYRIASLQIHSEKLQSRNRLTRLTELVGNLSVRIEASMARVVRSASERSPSLGHRSPIDRRE